MSDEAEDLLHDLWHRYRPQLAALKQRTFKSAELIYHLGAVLAVAPVSEHRGYFEVDPSPKPPAGAWRWIIAVRWGHYYRPVKLKAPPHIAPFAYSDTEFETLHGRHVEDLVAVSQDMTRVTSRMIGLATVVGWPQEPVFQPQGKPVRVRENPLAWLLARGDGIFFCGDDADVQTYLREFPAGVLVSTVEMGEAMEKKMKRAGINRPRILVDA